jgi:L-lactate dehydrogenase complex protein LldG
MSAREDILERIRHAIGERPVDRAREYASIARQYRVEATSSMQRVELFIDRLHDYNAAVYRCPKQQIPDTVAHALSLRQKRTVVIPREFPKEWLPYDLEFLDGTNLSYQELDKSAGVLTSCAVAIAFTGTIVLQHSPALGRRALTLIPDYHLCVVFEDQIVDTVPEGIRAIATVNHFPLTTVSGPSATSDIEMTRVKGVHGPRTLDVIIAG